MTFHSLSASRCLGTINFAQYPIPHDEANWEDDFAFRYLSVSKILGTCQSCPITNTACVGQLVVWFSKLFYGEELRHAPCTELIYRPLSRQISKFLTKKFDVNLPLMLYANKGVTEEDLTNSQFNISNASMVLNLMVSMIEEGVVRPSEVVVMTFYRAHL